MAKKTKVKRYEQRISQFRQNQLFLSEPKTSVQRSERRKTR